ncbi:MAG: VWA domain-containing protein, partial [Salinibacter sp.]
LSPSRQTGQARNVIADLDVDGGTNMAQGLQLANKQLQNAAPDSKRIIILLSDGVPTISSSGQEREPDELEAELLQGPVARAARNGTCLYVVGFGKPGVTRDDTPSIDPNFLRTMAQTTSCGRYHTARNADELTRIYTRLRHQTLGTIVGEFEGQVRQGDMADAGSFDVPADQDELHFSLSWPGSRLEPILIDPQGRRVDEDYPGASVVIRASLAQVIVNDPLPGRWHATIYGRDVPEGQINFDATASIRGPTSRPPRTDTTSNRNCTTVREAETGVQLQACGSDQWIAWLILGLLVLIGSALGL